MIYRVIMKKCTKCKENKVLTNFSKLTSSKDGLNTRCKICRNEVNALHKIKNKDTARIENAEWYINNKDHSNERSKRYNKDNKEKIRPKIEQWKKQNPERVRVTSVKYNKTNRHKCIVKANNQKLQKLKRTLLIFDTFNNDYINHLYIQAKELFLLDGVKRHVDHIIPLQGKFVSGLNVSWNLQILTSKENLIKGNKFDFTYDNNGWRTYAK